MDILMKKIPLKKPSIVDVELLPKDSMRRKMVLSGASSTSSTKKVMDCGKIEVVGPSVNSETGTSCLHSIYCMAETKTEKLILKKFKQKLGNVR